MAETLTFPSSLGQKKAQVQTDLDFSLLYSGFHQLHSTAQELTGVHDAPDGAEPRGAAQPHLPQVPVLSWSQIQHPAPVVGLLKHQPVALHDVAGLALGNTEAVHHVLTVVHQLVHLAREVLPLIDPQSEGSSLLWREILH